MLSSGPRYIARERGRRSRTSSSGGWRYVKFDHDGLITSTNGQIKKAERGEGGAELKRQRLAANVPRTLDNTRQFDSTSYLTSDPATLRAAAERAAEASRAVNAKLYPNGEDDDEGGEEDSDEDDEDEDNDEEMPEAGPSTIRPTAGSAGDDAEEDGGEADGEPDGEAEEGEEEEEEEVPQAFQPPPKILITTSPSPCKLTYNFCDDLRNVFPGGEFYKRPRGKGFELGRLARWGIKRGFKAVIVVNEDHKMPSERKMSSMIRNKGLNADHITVINLPAGPTAYFRLTSVQLGSEIHVSAPAAPAERRH